MMTPRVESGKDARRTWRSGPSGRASLRIALMVAAALLAVFASDAEAQRRGGGSGSGVEFTVEVRTQIRDFYAARPAINAEALPPGIRKRLERGKPLPPGIAKQVAPAELRSRVPVPEGYQLVEVGLDVLLVEVATNIVHDVLMDVIR